MPKLKESEEQSKNTQLKAIIAYKREILGLKNEDVAKLSGMGVSTLFNKLTKPRMFTLDELRRITKVLKFTDEEKAKFI